MAQYDVFANPSKSAAAEAAAVGQLWTRLLRLYIRGVLGDSERAARVPDVAASELPRPRRFGPGDELVVPLAQLLAAAAARP